MIQKGWLWTSNLPEYRDQHSHQAPQFWTTHRSLSSFQHQMTPVTIYVTSLTEHSSIFMCHNEVSGKFPCLSKASAPVCISLIASYFLEKPPGDLTLTTPVIYKQTHPNTLGNLISPSLFNTHLQFILRKMLFAWITVFRDPETFLKGQLDWNTKINFAP